MAKCAWQSGKIKQINENKSASINLVTTINREIVSISIINVHVINISAYGAAPHGLTGGGVSLIGDNLISRGAHA